MGTDTKPSRAARIEAQMQFDHLKDHLWMYKEGHFKRAEMEKRMEFLKKEYGAGNGQVV